MKKPGKTRKKPARSKSRPKKPANPVRVTGAGAGAGHSAAELFSGGFDFTASSEPVPDITAKINDARGKLAAGEPREAFALAQEALSSDPQNADALKVAGVAAFQHGNAESALDLFRTAIAYHPEDAEAQTNLGNALAATGETGAAEDAYRTAIACDASYADAHFNLGVLLENTGDTKEALDAYERAIALVPGHAGALAGRGNILKSLKRIEEAKAAYEAALARNPSLAEARTNLSAILQELGDFESAAREAKRAFEVDPELLEAEYNYAIALQELERYDEALEAYRDVLHHAPEFAPCALNIGYALQQLGRLDEAAEAFEKTIEIDPAFSKAHVNLADLRLQQGDPKSALEICDRFLEAHPGQTDLLAFRAVSLWDLGEEDEARHLIDFERFVQPVHVTPPPEYSGLDAFNDALCEHVLAHPTLTDSPQSHATRKGKHSGELLSEPKGPIAGLESEILRLAGEYRSALGTDPDHAFVARTPKDWTLSVWGVVMQAAGHQIPHIHPAAWLSGVYYPKLPDIVGEDAQGKAGWIEFGRPPDHFHNARAPETLSVKPEPGLMVLFPSYFYHHTVPFESEGTRISIAFDLMPA